MVNANVSFIQFVSTSRGRSGHLGPPTLQVADVGVQGGQQGLGEQKSQGPWGCGWAPPDPAAPLLPSLGSGSLCCP